MAEYRIETDSMGEVQVPVAAYFGAQTQRAFENFPISGKGIPRELIRALGIVKRACALANQQLGLLPAQLAEAIVLAADEVISGRHDNQFVVDVYQTGSGTSSNMNANEVISNRAIELLGGQIGSKKPVHPNDHVNKGQSSNDVFPTAIHVAALESIHKSLIPALEMLRDSLQKKAEEFDHIVKIGRTHLQDAVPIRLGQEFSGYVSQIEHGISRVRSLQGHLGELALGGTAVGTGLNTPPEFPEVAIEEIVKSIAIQFKPAQNRFEALAARDAVVEASGQLKTVAISLMKIVNDIRWLGSGPRCGIGELLLPDLQPGSSIMPGKVNPVIAESTMMLCATVIGNDAAIAIGGQHGNFELNVMMPMMALHLLESINLLTNGSRNLAEKLVDGLKADEIRATGLVEGSLAMVTALAPLIGYDAAAKIAKESYETGETVRAIARKHGVLPEEELARVLDPMRQTQAGKPSNPNK